MKKKFILFLLAVGLAIPSVAQQSYFSFQYSMGFGMGNVGDYISKPSFRGAALEWRQFLQPSMSLGLDVGWNTFYEDFPTETYTLGSASLTGKQFRYQNQVPIFLGFDYYLNPDQDLRPFIGVGLGTMYSRRNTDMFVYTFEQDAWHFAFRPEAGLLYKMNEEASLYVGLKYNVGTSAGDFDEAQSFLSLNVGIAFTK